MAYANTLSNEQEKQEGQKEALFQLLAFHKTSLTHFNPELEGQIPGFPCPSCLKTATTEYGIPPESQ